LGSCSADESVGSTENDSSQVPDTPEDSVVSGQRILFEVSYINFAWGFQFYGYYVDSAGLVHKFRYASDDDPWQPSDPDQITEEDLMEKYSHNPAFVTELDADVVSQNVELISDAAQGHMSKRTHEFCDFGSIVYTAYLYDDQDERYQPVTLLIYGDWTSRNQSQAAEMLVEWLKSIQVDWQY
jgi:hypothetical protein